VSDKQRVTGRGAPAPPEERPGLLRWWALASAAVAGVTGFIATLAADEGDAKHGGDKHKDGGDKNKDGGHQRHERTHGQQKSANHHDKAGRHAHHGNHAGQSHDPQNADAAQHGGGNNGGGGGNATSTPASTPPAGAAPTPTPPAATIGGTTALPPTNTGGATIQTADGTVIAQVSPMNGGAFARSGGVEASTGPDGAKVVIGQVSPINTRTPSAPPSGAAPTPTPTSGGRPGGNTSGGNTSGGETTPTPTS
jgi:hypothetical protein